MKSPSQWQLEAEHLALCVPPVIVGVRVAPYERSFQCQTRIYGESGMSLFRQQNDGQVINQKIIR